MAEIAIIGGGVAGASVALYLAQNKELNITLFEKEESLVSGPPMCHLHAGGNLYREIDDTQCLTLLKQSIDFMRLYPYAIDFRPTVIITPLDDPQKPEDLFPRLKMLRDEYSKMVEKNPKSGVLGKSSEYFRVFNRQEVEILTQKEVVDNPVTLEEWMIPVVKNTDLSRVQFPLIMVQEYGLNMFRISASASFLLRNSFNTTLHLSTSVQMIERCEYGYTIDGKKYDYLINAAGFRSGEIDDMVGFHRERLVEFKAAYVTKCPRYEGKWPEIIFHGERGTPRGMAQFTPYRDGYFQLHGMTKEITLFEDGLVKNSPLSAQPQLNAKFLHKIDKGWQFSTVKERTQSAIEHLAQYIPAFKNAQVASKPLFGAQQIPGDDANLRAAEVSFEGECYARCEIVKASSVISMAEAIMDDLYRLDLVKHTVDKEKLFNTAMHLLKKEDITSDAIRICQQREYPTSMAYLSVECMSPLQ